METNIITDEYRKIVADVNGDGEITASDYILIRNYIMDGDKILVH